MNFKPSLIKTIVSLVIGVIFGLIIGWQQYVIPTDLVWRFMFGPFILFFIISTILIYIIWSLIEKRSKK